MRIKSFQDLKVWQKGHQLVLEIYRITQSFPEDEKFGLVAQIRRSAVSICANISEGYKKSTKDFLRFLDIAQGSLEETKYHLILSRDLAYCTPQKSEQLLSLSDEIGRMAHSLQQKLR